MSEEQMPGTSSVDQDVNRRWREQSAEEPSSLADARIRAAARQAIASVELQGSGARQHARRTRFVPLAAAASVALLAVGLVRLIPREEYEAIPAPGLALPGEEPTAAPPAAARTPDAGDARSDHAIPPLRSPARRDEAPRDADSLSRRERTDPTESVRTHTLESPPRRVDDAAAEADRRDTSAAKVTAQNAARPVEPSPSAPRPEATASSTIESTAPSAVWNGAQRRSVDVPSLPDALTAQVRSDAARRTGADPAAIRIVAVERTAWSDESLGCDAQLDQAEETAVPGYVVTVEAPGTTLRYHTNDRDRVAVCQAE